jgi:hypothetical protein
VIGSEIERALAPYQENNMGDCPERFLSFHDQTADVVDGWAGLDADERAEYVGGIAAYAVDYHGYRAHPVVDGEQRFGYMENPNAKWDWWTVGGRWAGYFPTKTGDRNTALKSEIDWARKRDAEEITARARFARWQLALDMHAAVPRPLSWPGMRERYPHDIDAARAAYAAQIQIVEWKALCKSVDQWEAFDSDPPLDYGYDVEAYVARRRRAIVTPFAYVTPDGVWHEKGRMLMFACVADAMGEDDWCSQWEASYAALPDDTRLTVVDCHI